MAARREGQGSERRQRSVKTDIRWSSAEAAALRAAAARAGMSIAAFIRQQALGSPGPRSVRRLSIDARAVRELIGQLGYVGNNLNQLTRLANMGDLEEPRELAPVLRKISDAADACMAALGRDDDNH